MSALYDKKYMRELPILSLQSSTHNATASFEFFKSLLILLILVCVFKTSGLSLVVRTFQKENFSIVWCLAPLVNCL